MLATSGLPCQAQLITIEGHSLEPVIHNGAVVSVCAAGPVTSLKHGTYIILKGPQDRLLAKKMVARAGDHLAMKSEHLYVNGVLAKTSAGEAYVLTSPALRAAVALIPTVPAGSLFVLGERAGGSFDSSEFFLVPRRNVIGTVER